MALFSPPSFCCSCPTAQRHSDLGQGRDRVWRKFKVTLSMLMECCSRCCWSGAHAVPHPFRTGCLPGWAATWNSPQRDDDSTPWIEAVKRHGPQTLLGAAGRCWLPAESKLPVVAGANRCSLCCRSGVGDLQPYGLGLKARDEKFFLIPEEHTPPQELVSTDLYTHENRWHALKHGFIRAVVDPQQNALACALATSRH